MRQCGRLMAIILCLCMLLTAGAYAAPAEASGEAYGLFGRASDDKSVAVAGGGSYTYDIGQGDITGEGSSILLEIYLAGTSSGDRTLSAVLEYGGNKAEKELVKHRGSGEVFLGGTSVKNGIVLKNRWYKISLLMTSAGKLSLYIDGYYIAEKNIGISAIDGISSVTVSGTDVYCDDLTVSFVNSAGIAPIEFSSDNREIQAAMVRSVSKELFLSPYVTVAEFMNSLKTSAQVSVRSGNGDEVAPDSEEFVEGKYFVFEEEGVSPVYLKAETEITDMSSTQVRQTKNGGAGFVWETQHSGVGGREMKEELYYMGQSKTSQQLVDEGVLTSSQASARRDNGITFSGSRIAQSYVYYPFNISGWFYYRGNDTYLSTESKLLNPSGGGQFFTPIEVHANGRVKGLDGTEIMLEPETWNHIGITVYPGENPVLIGRINEKIVSYTENSGALPRIDAMKLYPTIRGGTQWGEVWLADLQTYTGAYRREHTMEDIVLESADKDIEVGDGGITVKRSFTAEELFAGIETSDNAELRLINAKHPKTPVADLSTTVSAEHMLLIISDGRYKYVPLAPDANVPVVTIENYGDGQEINSGNADALRVSVSGALPASRVELYVDSILAQSLTEAPFAFDMSSVTPGTHRITVRAENSGGYISEKTITVYIRDTIEVEKISENFENYVSGRPDCFAESARQKGYYEGGVFGDNPTRSFVLGIDKDRIMEQNTQGSWVGLKVSGGNRFAVEFDAYFNGRNNYRLDFKKEDKSPSTCIKIEGNSIKPLSSGGSAFVQIPYTDGVWYRMKLVFDRKEKKFSLYVTDKTGKETGRAINCPIKDGIEEFEWLRFCGPNDENVKSEFAIDNLRFVLYNDRAEIDSVDCETEDLGFAKSKLDAYMSKELSPDTISLNTVSLFEKDTEIKLSKVTYSKERKVIEIETNESLKGNTEYIIKLGEETKDTAGISAQTTHMFTTPSPNLEVGSCKITQDSLKCKVTNSSASDRVFYVIANVTEGSRIVASEVHTGTAKAQKTENMSFSIPKRSAGQSVSVYVWDSLLYPTSLLRYDLEAASAQ